MNACPIRPVARATLPRLPRRGRMAGTLATGTLALLCAAQLVACGGGEAGPAASRQETTSASAGLPDPLWRADGLALTTPAAARPQDPAARWSAERYASREQLAFEQLTAAPYTVIFDVDDEAAIEAALEAAARLREFSADSARLGVFVRSRQPALAVRLAERLTRELGWLNVFVVA